MSSQLAVWPGLHPGTGKNDHVHSWELFLVPGTKVELRACQMCGWPHPDDQKKIGL